MLEIKNVSKTFNPGTVNAKTALNGLNLVLEDGDFVTVIGGNGAGKSTMLNAIAGTWHVDEGSIIIDGEDVTNMPEYKRAKLLGRVFQDPMMGTAAGMQIDENLAIASRRGKRHSLRWGRNRLLRTYLPQTAVISQFHRPLHPQRTPSFQAKHRLLSKFLAFPTPTQFHYYYLFPQLFKR